MGGKFSGTRGLKYIARDCNICKKEFKAQNKFIRFCNNCRNSSNYLFEIPIYKINKTSRRVSES